MTLDTLASIKSYSERAKLWHQMRKCMRNKLGVREWSSQQVQTWVQKAGFSKHAREFQNLSGGDLLDLSIPDLENNLHMADHDELKRFEVEVELLRTLQVGLPSWSVERVSDWLISLDPNYRRYCPQVISNDITGNKLVSISESGLKSALIVEDNHHFTHIWGALNRLKLVSMPFTNWTPSQVIDWLSSLDPTFRKTYGSTILERQFDGENIAVVTHQALKNDLELKSSDEMIIWAALENLRKSKVDYLSWTPEEVSVWLECEDLRRHSTKFQDNEIDGQTLATLTHDELLEDLELHPKDAVEVWEAILRLKGLYVPEEGSDALTSSVDFSDGETVSDENSTQPMEKHVLTAFLNEAFDRKMDVLQLENYSAPDSYESKSSVPSPKAESFDFPFSLWHETAFASWLDSLGETGKLYSTKIREKHLTGHDLVEEHVDRLLHELDCRDQDHRHYLRGKIERLRQLPSPWSFWTPSDVVNWLGSVDYEYAKFYGPFVLQLKIDGPALAHIENKSVFQQELQIQESSHLDKIWDAIQELITNKEPLEKWNSDDVVNWLTCVDSGFAKLYGSICLAQSIDGKFLAGLHFDKFISLPFQSHDLALIWSSLIRLKKYVAQRPYSLWTPSDVLDWLASLNFEIALHSVENVMESEHRITGIDLICTPLSVLEKELDLSDEQWPIVSIGIDQLRTLNRPYSLWSSDQILDWLATIDPNIPNIYGTFIIKQGFDGAKLAQLDHNGLQRDLNIYDEKQQSRVWKAVLELRKVPRPYHAWTPAQVVDWVASFDGNLAQLYGEIILTKRCSGKQLDLISEDSLKDFWDLNESAHGQKIIGELIMLQNPPRPYCLWDADAFADYICSRQSNFWDLYGEKLCNIRSESTGQKINGADVLQLTEETVSSALGIENEDHIEAIWDAIALLLNMSAPFTNWSEEEVLDWCVTIEPAFANNFLEQFYSHRVDGNTLTSASEQELFDIMMTKNKVDEKFALTLSKEIWISIMELKVRILAQPFVYWDPFQVAIWFSTLEPKFWELYRPTVMMKEISGKNLAYDTPDAILNYLEITDHRGQTIRDALYRIKTKVSPVCLWDTEDVLVWVALFGEKYLDLYCPTIANNHFEGNFLMSIATKDDLTHQLQIQNDHHAHRIWKELCRFREFDRPYCLWDELKTLDWMATLQTGWHPRRIKVGGEIIMSRDISELKGYIRPVTDEDAEKIIAAAKKLFLLPPMYVSWTFEEVGDWVGSLKKEYGRTYAEQFVYMQITGHQLASITKQELVDAIEFKSSKDREHVWQKILDLRMHLPFIIWSPQDVQMWFSGLKDYFYNHETAVLEDEIFGRQLPTLSESDISDAFNLLEKDDITFMAKKIEKLAHIPECYVYWNSADICNWIGMLHSDYVDAYILTMFSKDFSGKDLVDVTKEGIQNTGIQGHHAEHILSELDKLRYTQKPLSTWGSVEVVCWLASLSKDYIDVYAKAATENMIFGPLLCTITESELKAQLNINNNAHAVHIWSELLRLRLQTRPYSLWDSGQIINWLSACNLDHYIDLFLNENITGKDLLHLTEETLLFDLKLNTDDVRILLGHQEELTRLEVPFSSWPKATTVDWLCSLDKSYVDLYGRNALQKNVNGTRLVKMKRDDLMDELGVENEAHADHIWEALLTLRYVEPPFSRWTSENVATWFSFVDRELGEKYEDRILEEGLDGMVFVSQSAEEICEALDVELSDIPTITDAFEALTIRERPYFLWSPGQVADHLVSLNPDFLDTYAQRAIEENITGEKFLNWEIEDEMILSEIRSMKIIPRPVAFWNSGHFVDFLGTINVSFVEKYGPSFIQNEFGGLQVIFECQEEMERDGDVELEADSEAIWKALLDIRSMPRPWCQFDSAHCVDFLTQYFAEGLDGYTSVIITQTKGADLMHFTEDQVADLFDEMDSDDIEEAWEAVQRMQELERPFIMWGSGEVLDWLCLVDKTLVAKYASAFACEGYELAHMTRDEVENRIIDFEDSEQVWNAIRRLRDLKRPYSLWEGKKIMDWIGMLDPELAQSLRKAEHWLDEDFLNGDMLYRKPITEFMMVQEEHRPIVEAALTELRQFHKPYTLWTSEIVCDWIASLSVGFASRYGQLIFEQELTGLDLSIVHRDELKDKLFIHIRNDIRIIWDAIEALRQVDGPYPLWPNHTVLDWVNSLVLSDLVTDDSIQGTDLINLNHDDIPTVFGIVDEASVMKIWNALEDLRTNEKPFIFWNTDEVVKWLAALQTDFPVSYGPFVIGLNMNGSHLSLWGRLEVVNVLHIDNEEHEEIIWDAIESLTYLHKAYTIWGINEVCTWIYQLDHAFIEFAAYSYRRGLLGVDLQHMDVNDLIRSIQIKSPKQATKFYQEIAYLRQILGPYTKWTHDDFCNWVVGLDPTYVPYGAAAHENRVKGDQLSSITLAQVKSLLEIEEESHAEHIYFEIENLRTPSLPFCKWDPADIINWLVTLNPEYANLYGMKISQAGVNGMSIATDDASVLGITNDKHLAEIDKEIRILRSRQLQQPYSLWNAGQVSDWLATRGFEYVDQVFDSGLMGKDLADISSDQIHDMLNVKTDDELSMIMEEIEFLRAMPENFLQWNTDDVTNWLSKLFPDLGPLYHKEVVSMGLNGARLSTITKDELFMEMEPEEWHGDMIFEAISDLRQIAKEKEDEDVRTKRLRDLAMQSLNRLPGTGRKETIVEYTQQFVNMFINAPNGLTADEKENLAHEWRILQHDLSSAVGIMPDHGKERLILPAQVKLDSPKIPNSHQTGPSFGSIDFGEFPSESQQFDSPSMGTVDFSDFPDGSAAVPSEDVDSFGAVDFNVFYGLDDDEHPIVVPTNVSDQLEKGDMDWLEIITHRLKTGEKLPDEELKVRNIRTERVDYQAMLQKFKKRRNMRNETKEGRLKRLKEEQEEHFESVLYNVDGDDSTDTATTENPDSVDSAEGSEIVLSALNFQGPGSTLHPVKRIISTNSADHTRKPSAVSDIDSRRASALSSKGGRYDDSDEAEEMTVYSISGLDQLSPILAARLRSETGTTMSSINSVPILTPPSNSAAFHLVVEDLAREEDITEELVWTTDLDDLMDKIRIKIATALDSGNIIMDPLFQIQTSSTMEVIAEALRSGETSFLDEVRNREDFTFVCGLINQTLEYNDPKLAVRTHTRNAKKEDEIYSAMLMDGLAELKIDLEPGSEPVGENAIEVFAELKEIVQLPTQELLTEGLYDAIGIHLPGSAYGKVMKEMSERVEGMEMNEICETLDEWLSHAKDEDVIDLDTAAENLIVRSACLALQALGPPERFDETTDVSSSDVKTEQEEDWLEDLYSVVDVDHDGGIDFDEFRSLLELLNLDTNMETMHLGFAYHDTGGTGVLNLEEFKHAVLAEAEWRLQNLWTFAQHFDGLHNLKHKLMQADEMVGGSDLPSDTEKEDNADTGKHVGNIDHCMIPELGESVKMNLDGEVGYDDIREMVEELGLAPDKEATLKKEFEKVAKNGKVTYLKAEKLVKKRLRKSNNWTRKVERGRKFRGKKSKDYNADKYARKKRTREWAPKEAVDVRPLKRSRQARKVAATARKARRTREWKRKDPRTEEGRAVVESNRKAKKAKMRKKNNYEGRSKKAKANRKEWDRETLLQRLLRRCRKYFDRKDKGLGLNLDEVQDVLRSVGYKLDVLPIYEQLEFDPKRRVDWEQFRQIVRLVAREDPDLLETYRKLLDRRVQLVSRGDRLGSFGNFMDDDEKRLWGFMKSKSTRWWQEVDDLEAGQCYVDTLIEHLEQYGLGVDDVEILTEMMNEVSDTQGRILEDEFYDIFQSYLEVNPFVMDLMEAADRKKRKKRKRKDKNRDPSLKSRRKMNILRRTRPLFQSMNEAGDESVSKAFVKSATKPLLKSKKKEATLDELLQRFCNANQMRYGDFHKFMEIILNKEDEVLDLEKLLELMMKILHSNKKNGDEGKSQSRAKKMKTVLNYIRQIFNHRNNITGKELNDGLTSMGLSNLRNDLGVADDQILDADGTRILLQPQFFQNPEYLDNVDLYHVKQWRDDMIRVKDSKMEQKLKATDDMLTRSRMIFNMVNNDEGKFINYEEFISICHTFGLSDVQDKLKNLFNQRDTDKDGHLSFDEFRQLIKDELSAHHSVLDNIDLVSVEKKIQEDVKKKKELKARRKPQKESKRQKQFKKKKKKALTKYLRQANKLFNLSDKNERGEIELEHMQDLMSKLGIDGNHEGLLDHWDINSNSRDTMGKREFFKFIAQVRTNVEEYMNDIPIDEKALKTEESSGAERKHIFRARKDHLEIKHKKAREEKVNKLRTILHKPDRLYAFVTLESSMNLDNFQSLCGELGIDGFHPDVVKWFHKYDENDDGVLSRKEFGSLIEKIVSRDNFANYVDSNMKIDYVELEDAIADAYTLANNTKRNSVKSDDLELRDGGTSSNLMTRTKSHINRNQSMQHKIDDLKKILRRRNRLYELADKDENGEIDEEAFLDLMGKLGLDIIDNGLVLMFEMYVKDPETHRTLSREEFSNMIRCSLAKQFDHFIDPRCPIDWEFIRGEKGKSAPQVDKKFTQNLRGQMQKLLKNSVRLWDFLEKNEEGLVEKRGFFTFLKQIGLDIKKSELQKIWNAYDQDGNGVLDIREFRRLVGTDLFNQYENFLSDDAEESEITSEFISQFFDESLDRDAEVANNVESAKHRALQVILGDPGTLFDNAQKSKQGTFTQDSLELLLSRLGLDNTNETIIEAFYDFADDSDLSVNREQFIDFIASEVEPFFHLYDDPAASIQFDEIGVAFKDVIRDDEKFSSAELAVLDLDAKHSAFKDLLKRAHRMVDIIGKEGHETNIEEFVNLMRAVGLDVSDSGLVKMFHQYDTSHKQSLSVEEIKTILADLESDHRGFLNEFAMADHMQNLRRKSNRMKHQKRRMAGSTHSISSEPLHTKKIGKSQIAPALLFSAKKDSAKDKDMEQVLNMSEAIFGSYDYDNDGYLDASEVERFMQQFQLEDFNIMETFYDLAGNTGRIGPEEFRTVFERLMKSHPESIYILKNTVLSVSKHRLDKINLILKNAETLFAMATKKNQLTTIGLIRFIQDDVPKARKWVEKEVQNLTGSKRAKIRLPEFKTLLEKLVKVDDSIIDCLSGKLGVGDEIEEDDYVDERGVEFVKSAKFDKIASDLFAICTANKRKTVTAQMLAKFFGKELTRDGQLIEHYVKKETGRVNTALKIRQFKKLLKNLLTDHHECMEVVVRKLGLTEFRHPHKEYDDNEKVQRVLTPEEKKKQFEQDLNVKLFMKKTRKLFDLIDLQNDGVVDMEEFLEFLDIANLEIDDSDVIEMFHDTGTGDSLELAYEDFRKVIKVLIQENPEVFGNLEFDSLSEALRERKQGTSGKNGKQHKFKEVDRNDMLQAAMRIRSSVPRSVSSPRASGGDHNWLRAADSLRGKKALDMLPRPKTLPQLGESRFEKPAAPFRYNSVPERGSFRKTNVKGPLFEVPKAPDKALPSRPKKSPKLASGANFAEIIATLEQTDKVFSVVDIDCDGEVDSTEFILFLEDFGLMDMDDAIYNLFNTYDLQRTGKLGKKEFASAIKYGIIQNESLLSQLNPDAFKKRLESKGDVHVFKETPQDLFEIIDSNDNGRLELEEIEAFFVSIPEVNIEALRDAVADHDTNNRGWLTCEQFETMISLGQHEMNLKVNSHDNLYGVMQKPTLQELGQYDHLNVFTLMNDIDSEDDRDEEMMMQIISDPEKMFKIVDEDEDGRVYFEDIVGVMEALEIDYEHSALEAAFDQCDKNGVGQIGVDEFQPLLLETLRPILVGCDPMNFVEYVDQFGGIELGGEISRMSSSGSRVSEGMFAMPDLNRMTSNHSVKSRDATDWFDLYLRRDVLAFYQLIDKDHDAELSVTEMMAFLKELGVSFSKQELRQAFPVELTPKTFPQFMDDFLRPTIESMDPDVFRKWVEDKDVVDMNIFNVLSNSHRVFHAMDTNDDGIIKFEELYSFLKELEIPGLYRKEDVSRLFDAYSNGPDDVMNLEEFQEMLENDLAEKLAVFSLSKLTIGFNTRAERPSYIGYEEVSDTSSTDSNIQSMLRVNTALSGAEEMTMALMGKSQKIYDYIRFTDPSEQPGIEEEGVMDFLDLIGLSGAIPSARLHYENFKKLRLNYQEFRVLFEEVLRENPHMMDDIDTDAVVRIHDDQGLDALDGKQSSVASAISGNIEKRMETAKQNRKRRSRKSEINTALNYTRKTYKKAKDQDSSLRLEAFYDLLQSLHFDYDWDQCVQIFNQYDVDESHSLSYEEFREIVKQKLRCEFSKNNSSIKARKDFRPEAMESLRSTFSDNEVSELLDLMDEEYDESEIRKENDINRLASEMRKELAAMYEDDDSASDDLVGAL